MNDRQKLLLALGITEWANAMSHLDAMMKQGLVVPADVVRSVGRELAGLIHQWPTSPGSSIESVIAGARLYCTEHVAELDAL
jgi:hypothetical protein